MHFRTKLLLAFIALATLSCFTTFYAVYRTAKKALFEESQKTVLSIAVEAAATVDAALHEQISLVDANAHQGDAYRKIEATLRSIRDRHRSTGIDVAFIYTIRPKISDSSHWVYVVDAEEANDQKSLPGERFSGTYADGSDIQPVLQSPPSVDAQYSNDEFGDWLSADAPITDSTGRIIARVGADLRAPTVRATSKNVWIRSLPIFLSCLALGTLLAFYLSRWANRPLKKISHALERIGSGETDFRITITRTDEFAQVQHAVNNMAESLQELDALQNSFARYVSRDMARDVAKIGPEIEIEAGGTKRHIAVLFCSLDDFEDLSERVPAKDAITILNAFFAKMIHVIFSHGGTLDSFVGAGLMATFGATRDDSDFIGNSLKSALAMHSDIEKLAIEMEHEHGIRVGIRIGLHSGMATVCSRGGSKAMSFMALGTAVNNASRVLAEVRESRYPLLISKPIATALEGRYAFMEVTTIPSGEDEAELILFRIID